MPMKGRSIVEQFREPGTVLLSATRVSKFFGYCPQELAARARVPENTPLAQPDNRKLQEYLRELLRVLAAATELTGDPRRAAVLICTEPIPAFHSKTADWLVSEGRADDVIAYLESFAGGASG